METLCHEKKFLNIFLILPVKLYISCIFKAGDDVDAYLQEVSLLADKITELKNKAGTVPSYQEAKDKSEVCSFIYSSDMSKNE